MSVLGKCPYFTVTLQYSLALNTVSYRVFQVSIMSIIHDYNARCLCLHAPGAQLACLDEKLIVIILSDVALTASAGYQEYFCPGVAPCYAQAVSALDLVVIE